MPSIFFSAGMSEDSELTDVFSCTTQGFFCHVQCEFFAFGRFGGYNVFGRMWIYIDKVFTKLATRMLPLLKW